MSEQPKKKSDNQKIRPNQSEPENQENPNQQPITKGPPSIPPNFTKRPKTNRTAPPTVWSKTTNTNRNPFSTPFNPADPFSDKPIATSYTSTPAFIRGKPNSNKPGRKTVKLTELDHESLCPFKRLQREEKKKKQEERRLLEERVEKKMAEDEIIWQDKRESWERLGVMMEEEERMRKVEEKARKMEEKAKKVKENMKNKADLLKVRHEHKKPGKKFEIFNGNMEKMVQKTDVNGNYSFAPINTNEQPNNNNSTNLENSTHGELINKVLDLHTHNAALETMLEQATSNNPNQEEQTNRKLKIKNKYISTTLEEMNTAIGLRNAAFTDINMHLANFNLGFIDTAATYKRKSSGRGCAVLIMPNGKGNFQLNGKLAENNSYKAEISTKISAQNPEKTNSTTQTNEANTNASKNTNMQAKNGEDEQDEKMGENDEVEFSQKPVPDEFKD